MLVSQGYGHTVTEVFDGPMADLHQRVVAQLRELVGEQAGAANVTAVTSQRYGLSASSSDVTCRQAISVGK